MTLSYCLSMHLSVLVHLTVSVPVCPSVCVSILFFAKEIMRCSPFIAQ
jgi:hypothetical protein